MSNSIGNCKSEIKNFTVKSGELIATDPCYHLSKNCSLLLKNVKNGVWCSSVNFYASPSDMQNLQDYVDEIKDLIDLRKQIVAKKLGKDIDEVTVEDDGKILKHAMNVYNSRLEEQREYRGKVARLHIWHETFVDNGSYELINDKVCVDSGQAGFFDGGFYNSVQAAGIASEISENFYNKITDVILSKSFGAIDHGVASFCGYGDGTYQCFVQRSASGEIIAAYIEFIRINE